MRALGVISALGVLLLVGLAAHAAAAGKVFRLRKGRRYVVLFRLPHDRARLTDAELEAFRSIMPPGANVSESLADDQFTRVVSVAFVAPTDADLTDLETPIGTFEVMSLMEVG